MGLIAVSDVHLGYEKSNKDDFKDFLEMISTMEDIDKFVLCGDILDMWRRDIAGVIIENMDILEQLQNLKSENNIEVHYIVGNHDYHLTKLSPKYHYPFTFYESKIQRDPIRRDYFEPLPLQDRGRTYRFTHGYEYEPIQRASRHAFDMLCYSSDEIGGFESDVWTGLRELFTRREIREAFRPAKERLNDQKIREIERIASEVRLKEGETLVFGHTHKPFINRDNTVINLGSWVKDYDVHNTYLEIKNGEMKLKKFPSEEEIKPIG